MFILYLKTVSVKGGNAMRKIFFLSLALLVLTAGLSLAAVQFLSPWVAFGPTLDGDTPLTVLQDGKVVKTTMARWLPGVVAAEMPASFEPEALKAQAVAARTYILERAENPPENHPECAVFDDPACCCAWRSEAALRESWGAEAAGNLRRIHAAVTATDGAVLTYAGTPIRAVFHSSSAGQTESSAALWGALPYLVSVSSPETAADVPNFQSEVTVSPEDVRKAVLEADPACVLQEDPTQWLGETALDDSGRVASLTIGSTTLSGAQVRQLFDLRSTAFTAEYTEGVFRFTVTGYGHGVGMSQYGANVLAQQGRTYEEILAHYYPGTELHSTN